jgi:hypothetical protein
MNEHSEQDVVAILDECLEHYARMREYVAMQIPTEWTDHYQMRYAIKEGWYGDDCPACQAFGAGSEDCGNCPLAGHGSVDRYRCCNGLWNKMDNSENWGDFLPAMDNMIAFIREKRDEAAANNRRRESCGE